MAVDPVCGMWVDEDFSVREAAQRRVSGYGFIVKGLKAVVPGILHGTWALAILILWWALIGILAASFIGAYVPSYLFMEYVGPTVLGLFITLAAATLIGVCSEGSFPIAFEIFRQKGALGNSFVFLGQNWVVQPRNLIYVWCFGRWWEY